MQLHPRPRLQYGKALLLVIMLVAVLAHTLLAPTRLRAASQSPTGISDTTPLTTPLGTCTAGACLFAGPRLASVDSTRGPLINALTSALLGNTINLSVLDWNSLAAADLDLLRVISALQTNLELASPEEVLNTDITLAQLIEAAIDVAEADGNTAAVAALGAMLAQVAPLTGTIQLGDLIQSDFPIGSLAAIDLDILSLITGAASLFNYENVATTPQPVAINGSTLEIPGLSGLELYAQVVEPPIIKCGPAGTEFYSAAVRLKLNLALTTTPLVVNAGVATVTLSLTNASIYLDVARTQGTITFVDRAIPRVDVNVQPGVVHAYLGTIDDVVFFNRDTVITPEIVSPATIAGLQIIPLIGRPVTTGLTAESATIGTTTSANLSFTGGLPQEATVGTSATFIATLLSTLMSNLELGVNPAVLDSIINTILNVLRPIVVNVISPILAGVLGTVADPLLDTLGIGLGESDVRVLSVQSDCPVDLGVTVDASDARPNVGESVTFTVTVTNFGITDSTGFDLRGLLPSSLSLVSAIPSAGTYNTGTGTATTGYLTQDYVYELLLTATVNPGTEGSTITLAQQVQGYDNDPNLSNNSASDSVVVNRPPLAGNDVIQVPPDSSTIIPILINDSDPDGNIVPTTVTIITPPAQGSVVVNPNGTVTFIAPPTFSGTAFTYQVCDNDGACDTATVIVGVDLSVVLDSFTGGFVPNGVLLEWVTLQETENLGFDLYRADAPTLEPQRVTDTMIPSQATGSGTGAAYEWIDQSAVTGSTYWYWLETVDMYGGRMRFGPIMVSESEPTAVTLTTLTVQPMGAPVHGVLLVAVGIMFCALAWSRRR